MPQNHKEKFLTLVIADWFQFLINYAKKFPDIASKSLTSFCKVPCALWLPVSAPFFKRCTAFRIFDAILESKLRDFSNIVSNIYCFSLSETQNQQKLKNDFMKISKSSGEALFQLENPTWISLCTLSKCWSSTCIILSPTFLAILLRCLTSKFCATTGL